VSGLRSVTAFSTARIFPENNYLGEIQCVRGERTSRHRALDLAHCEWAPRPEYSQVSAFVFVKLAVTLRIYPSPKSWHPTRDGHISTPPLLSHHLQLPLSSFLLIMGLPFNPSRPAPPRRRRILMLHGSVLSDPSIQPSPDISAA